MTHSRDSDTEAKALADLLILGRQCAIDLAWRLEQRHVAPILVDRLYTLVGFANDTLESMGVDPLEQRKDKR